MVLVVILRFAVVTIMLVCIFSFLVRLLGDIDRDASTKAGQLIWIVSIVLGAIDAVRHYRRHAK